jgi:hypothetical protein
MRRRVAGLVFPDVSKHRVTLTVEVKRSSKDFFQSKVLRSFEMSANTDPAIRCHNREDMDSWQRHCANLKPRIFLLFFLITLSTHAVSKQYDLSLEELAEQIITQFMNG